MTVGKGVDVRNGILVTLIESVIGSGDDAEGRPDSISDALEQPVANTINSNRKNNRFISIWLPPAIV